MKTINLILMACISCLLFACSTATDKCTNVSQARIHQSYSANYDQTNNTTSVIAEARFGGSSGTTLETDGKCAFAHNLFTLSKVNILGTSYTASNTGLSLDHTFTFTNNESVNYTNSCSILAIALSSPPTTIAKSSGVTVNWTGGGVRADETVYLYVSDGSRTVSESTSTLAATTLTMTASTLSSLTGTSGTIYLKRQQYKSSGLSVAEVGGNISNSYETSKSAVTITN